MSDVRSILSLYDHARANALPAVLATVVRTSGSTYRKAGARMMLCADGSRVGVVSGGCLEGDVQRRAWFLRDAGDVELVRYDTGQGEDATYEFGLGCRGVVEVLLERLDVTRDPLIIAAMRDAIDRRVATTFETRVRNGNIGERTTIPVGEAGADTFVERVAPPAQLVIFGSGVDVPPVVRIANAVGWQTIVIDARARPTPEASRSLALGPAAWRSEVVIDLATAFVVMTHRMDDDAAYLRDAIATNAPYVGCLGPASRTEALLDAIALDGVTLEGDRRRALRGPIGLDLGAESPEEIALSIVSEIQAVFANGDGGPLSGREGPIHRSRLSTIHPRRVAGLS